MTSLRAPVPPCFKNETCTLQFDTHQSKMFSVSLAWHGVDLMECWVIEMVNGWENMCLCCSARREVPVLHVKLTLKIFFNCCTTGLNLRKHEICPNPRLRMSLYFFPMIKVHSCVLWTCSDTVQRLCCFSSPPFNGFWYSPAPRIVFPPR